TRPRSTRRPTCSRRTHPRRLACPGPGGVRNAPGLRSAAIARTGRDNGSHEPHRESARRAATPRTPPARHAADARGRALPPEQNGWPRGPKLSPAVTPQAALPFAAQDGQKARRHRGKGYFGTTAFKAAPADRVMELLRIASWLAAPFGSAEDLLLTVGVKDI